MFEKGGLYTFSHQMSYGKIAVVSDCYFFHLCRGVFVAVTFLFFSKGCGDIGDVNNKMYVLVNFR